MSRSDCPTPHPRRDKDGTVLTAEGASLCFSAPPPPHGGVGICLLVWCYLPLIWGETSVTID